MIFAGFLLFLFCFLLFSCNKLTISSTFSAIKLFVLKKTISSKWKKKMEHQILIRLGEYYKYRQKKDNSHLNM